MQGRTTWPVRYMLIDMALYTGLRVAELAALRVGDLHLDSDTDPYLIVRNGKGNKRRTVYFDNVVSKHLRQFLIYKVRTLHQQVEDDSPLFTGREGQHSPPITLMKSFKMAIYEAHLRPELSIHACRHTYATFLLHDTQNLRYVQQQLGHSSIGMTSLYANILPEDNGRLANMIQREDE